MLILPAKNDGHNATYFDALLGTIPDSPTTLLRLVQRSLTGKAVQDKIS